MNPTKLSDRMITHDDMIVVNKLARQGGIAPRGRLFQKIGEVNGKRIVKEIACNTVVVGGAIFALKNILGVTPNWEPTTLNDIYGVGASGSAEPRLCLFGIGMGGSNLDFGSVISPDIKQRDILSPIPLRYGVALTGDDTDKYFMKLTNSDGTTFSWYLKEFMEDPVIKSCWKNAVSSDEDGTEITEDIYDSTNSESIETFAEININLTTLDGKEYFDTIGSTSSARFNTIGFYSGSLSSDGEEYGDVRLYSCVTFNNRDLSISSTSEFTYRLYSLI